MRCTREHHLVLKTFLNYYVQFYFVYSFYEDDIQYQMQVAPRQSLQNGRLRNDVWLQCDSIHAINQANEHFEV